MNDQFTADQKTSAFNSRLLRRAFLLALIPAVVLAGKLAHSAETYVAAEKDKTWKIEITPRTRSTEVALQDATDEAAPAPVAEALPEPATIESAIEVPPAIVDEPAEDSGTAGEFGIAIVPVRKFTVNGLTYRQVYESIPFSRAEYLANPSYRQEATMELLTGTPRQTVIHRTYEPQLNEPSQPQPEFLYNRYGTFGGTFGPQVGYGGGFGGGFYMPQYAPAFRYFLPLDYGF